MAVFTHCLAIYAAWQKCHILLQPQCRLIYAHYCRPWRWNTGGQGIHKCSFFFTYCSSPSSGLLYSVDPWTWGPELAYTKRVHTAIFSVLATSDYNRLQQHQPYLFCSLIGSHCWCSADLMLQEHCKITVRCL